MNIPIRKRGWLTGILTAGAMAVSSQAMAVPVSMTLDYTCTYPLIGDEPLTADISSDMPETLPAGEETGSFDIDVLATAKGDTRTGLELVGGTNVEGTATAFSNVSGNNLNLDVDVPITIPNQAIEEGTGSFQLTANGSTPSLTFTENNAGDVVIQVGGLDMLLTARNDAGEPVMFPNSDPDTGEFPVPCVVDAGQDTVLHTFEVTTDPGDPDIVVSPEALDFGDVQAGTDATQPVTVNNDGQADLSVNNVSIGGLDAGDFTQSNDCTTVAPGDSCTVDVTFFASGEGPSEADLNIDSNDPDEPTVQVLLDGNSVPIDPPTAEVSPTSIEFGDVPAGTNAVETLTVSNSGSQDLGINSVALSGPDAGAFTQTNNCTTVAAGGSCEVEVTFFASGEGARTATLAIDSTDPNNPTVDVPVSGTSVIDDPADISVDPAQLDFGSVDVGASASESITVTNAGGDPLDITGITIGGDNAGDFMQSHDCSQLAADASCTVDVTFTPSTEGTRNATLTIDSNDADTPSLDVPMTGEGGDAGPGVDMELDIDGETKLKNLRHPIPLSGMVDANVELATGLVTADLDLDPTTGKLKLPFYSGVSIDVEFEQTEQTTGTYNAGDLTTSSSMHLVLTEIRAKVFGFEFRIGGSDKCRTIDPAVIDLASPEDEPFSLQTGGPVEGTYTLPPVDNCGGLEGLINPIMAGEGNNIRLNLTPKD